MIKSLYLRIVLTFLAIVLVSITVASYMTSHLYDNQSTKRMRDDLTNTGQKAIQVYNRNSFQDFENFADLLSTLNGYSIVLYNENGDVKTYGSGPKKDMPTAIVSQVLAGETFVNSSQNLELQKPAQSVIGLPFLADNTKYALFITPERPLPPPPPRNGFNTFLNTVLLIVLIVGSLLILVFSRYLVKPIQAITAATRRIAKGDFDIALQLNRRDEIGILADSFTRMAQELKQLEEMRQEFVSNVSHEIQSPLTSIQGFSKALREGVIPESDRDRYLEIIENESERISRMSENLLKLASLESEHHPFHPKRYALDEQVRRTILITEPHWAAKDLELDLDLPKTPAFADEDLLGQVWMNLILNSIRYTPVGGKLTISITTTKQEVLVTIRDTGIGIPAEEKQKIFERFYKVDKARTRSVGGSGLGLSIVKKIVDMHDGRIELESAVGVGTTVTVLLPREAR